MLKLISPDAGTEQAVMEFRREFIDRGERISGGVGLEHAEDYGRWLAGDYPPHYGKVREQVFLAVDAADNPSDGRPHIVGISDIRLEPNDFIDHFAGRIGYSVRPSDRGRGYAHEILRLTLFKARELGFPRILVTCNQTNVASAKVIERNHGVLEAVVPHPGFPDVRRYWINLV
ncbi:MULTISPECIES: GNAT family N-acetyltransferase [Bifidobacterium]|uniref:GNAT family N-acetyltransferase n=1 Tax=Bifidobacterium TaxID=1678 RepID=UPI001BDCF8ED|nr:MULTISPECIES: GNAT family N-acetyltransferase [Bifidobacterium]MBT1160673.1 GNAT family N-acetyltransferase [Bifidobacterium sp. SO1]MBW3079489.1 GNAT family N-acetyltransferase [Bifidobacterium simiiventris]